MLFIGKSKGRSRMISTATSLTSMATREVRLIRPAYVGEKLVAGGVQKRTKCTHVTSAITSYDE